MTFPAQEEFGGHLPGMEEKKAEPSHSEEEEARQREHERREQEAEQMRQEQEAERARLEEQRRREAEEQLRREREEAEARQRRELEEARQAEAARQAEKERVAQEQQRKAVVGAFLRQHGYSDVRTPKRTMMKAKYPIHTAAKMGNSRIVEALIEEGANPGQKNSAGQTALQVAQQKNKKGSHANVLRVLGGA